MKTEELREQPSANPIASDPDLRMLAGVRRELIQARAGEHLFRPLEPDDYWRLWLATRHPEFNRCLPWPAPDAPEHTLERVRQLLAEQQAGLSISFACETPAANRQWDAIFRFTRWRDGYETGLWLHPDAWSKGIGTRIIAAAIQAAFAATEVPAIYSKTSEDNIGAHRITTRCGMSVIGEASAPDERGGIIRGIEWRITRAEARAHAAGLARHAAAA